MTHLSHVGLKGQVFFRVILAYAGIQDLFKGLPLKRPGLHFFSHPERVVRVEGSSTHIPGGQVLKIFSLACHDNSGVG